MRTVALIAAINAVVLFNALAQDPVLAYDGADHVDMVTCMARGRLPGPDCSRESYSPPVPYVLPALWLRATGCAPAAAMRVGLLFNVGCSLALCWLLVLLCRLAHPPGSACEAWTLALLGLMPAYYRTFAMVRGEPALSVACAAAIYLLARAQKSGRARDYRLAGAAFGAAALCRQWFVLMVPGVVIGAVLMGSRQERSRALKGIAPCALAAAAVGGWFYAWHLSRFGHLPWRVSPLSSQISLAGLRHFVGLDSSWAAMRLYPVVGYPIPFALYADWWGDIQDFFLLFGRDAAGHYVIGPELIRGLGVVHSNLFSMRLWLSAGYFGGLPPTALMLAGLALALFSRRLVPRVCALSTLTSVGGLAVWAFFYSFDNPAWLKMTYLAMIMPWLAYLGGEAAARLEGRFAQASLAAVLGVSALLLCPLWTTRYLTPRFEAARRLYPEERWGRREPADAENAFREFAPWDVVAESLSANAERRPGRERRERPGRE